MRSRAVEDVDTLKTIFKKHCIQPDSLILDLACGIGWHTILLAENNYRVVGLDISAGFITRAREMAEEKGVNPKFIVADMREVYEALRGYEGSFDAVLNLFTSMGYWDRDTDRKILEQVRKLVKPGGLLLIDIVNRDWIIRNFQSRDVTYRENGLVKTVERKLDLEDSRIYNRWRYYKHQDEDLKHIDTFDVDHLLYSLHEIIELVEESGWSYKESYGGYDLSEVTINSHRILLSATKT